MHGAIYSLWITRGVRLLGFVFVVFAIVTPFRYFVAQPFIVSGASMIPTFNPHDYLVIDRLSYRNETPERGDVIVFKYPLDPSTYFIKRVIGLPGETVRIEQGDVQIGVGDVFKTLDEPYRSGTMPEDSQITLASDEYFVMGDNRGASLDSRVWGPMKERYLVGRPIVRLFPFSRVETVPGVEK